MIDHFYTDDAQVLEDPEVQGWLQDLQLNGLSRDTGDEPPLGLPLRFQTKEELGSLLTRIVFTSTCRHAGSHSEAMDMYAHEPKVSQIAARSVSI